MIRHLRAGLKYGYPLCCIIRFAIGQSGRQAQQRGCYYSRDGNNSWVPCGIFHRAHRTFEESSRADRLRLAGLMENLEALLGQEPELHLQNGHLLYRFPEEEWRIFG